MEIKKVSQLVVSCADAPGKLADLTGAIAQGNININAICAYGMQGKAVFYLLTDNNSAAKNVLGQNNWQVKEEEVVAVLLEDKPAALKAIADKLKEKSVNLEYCYGSAGKSLKECLIVLKSANNDSIIAAIK